MAINLLPNTVQTAWVPDLTDSDISKMIQSIVGSLKCNARDFEHAKQTYNSDFFKGESAEFKREVCKALHTFFAPVGTSLFWKKQAGV